MRVESADEEGTSNAAKLDSSKALYKELDLTTDSVAMLMILYETL
jgi:hypothetical protein